MPEHYDAPFYDKLDDILYYLGLTLDKIEEHKDIWQTQILHTNPQQEINSVKNILDSTPLANTLPIFQTCIENISSALLEQSKAFSSIMDLVKRDTKILQECRTNVFEALQHLDELKKQADEREVTLLDYVELKLGDTNIFLLDAFYS